MDQTPLPFEYSSGQTYDIVEEKIIWIKASAQSGWDKHQATFQLTVFIDGVPGVKPLILYRGLGVSTAILGEITEYDPHVVVKFNSTAYANSKNIIE